MRNSDKLSTIFLLPWQSGFVCKSEEARFSVSVRLTCLLQWGLMVPILRAFWG